MQRCTPATPGIRAGPVGCLPPEARAAGRALTTTGFGALVAAAAALRRSQVTAVAGGNGAAAAPAPWATRPWSGLAPVPTRGSCGSSSSAAVARFFRKGNEREGTTPAGNATAAAAAAAAAAGAAAANAGGQDPKLDAADTVGPLSNAVPFVPSTRQPHAVAHNQHEHHNYHNHHNRSEDYSDRRRGGSRREELLLHDTEERAVGVHPDILIDDLAAEATVPYGAAGTLDGGDGAVPYSDYGSGVGTADGPPSTGAGPHGGLEVEDVDPKTGGFTTSRPDVDPAYDDVGRAIRAEERGPLHPHPRRPGPSLLSAEALTRKAATAEDLRENLLDQVPELQDVYGVYGSGGGIPTRVELGSATVGDEQLEAFMERSAMGMDGAVLTEEMAVTSSAEDPLAPPPDAAVAGGGPGGSDPLAPLDTLAHLAALDVLEDITTTDVADVMPAPPQLFQAVARPPAEAAVATSPARATSRGGSSRRGRMRLASAGTRARAKRRGVLPPTRRAAGRVVRSAPATAAGAAATGPPFYHNSPDVPDEDLEQARHRLHRRRPRGTVPGGGGGADVSRTREQPSAGTTATSAGRIVGSRARAAEYIGGSVYGNSPDVLDEDLERSREEGRSPSAVAPAAPPPTSSELPRHPSTAIGSPPPPGPNGHATGAATRVTHVTSVMQLNRQQGPQAAAPKLPTAPPQASAGAGAGAGAGAHDGRRLKSLSDVDRQFIDLDTVSGWDEQAHALRSTMRSTIPKSGRTAPQLQPRQPTQPPGARGAYTSLHPQTIGIHGNAGGAALTAGPGGPGGGAAAPVPAPGSGGVTTTTGSAGGDGRAVTVLRVECVPSQTYGGARTAAVLAADGKLTLLARPTGPSPERVRAAIRLLRMQPDSRDFREGAAAAAAEAEANDERAMAAEEAAVVAAVTAATNAAAVSAAAAAAGTPGMELEAESRPSSGSSMTSPGLSGSPSVDERDLIQNQPGLILGVTEINPDDMQAEPGFHVASAWHPDLNHDLHHDPHDPHGGTPMLDPVEGRGLGLEEARLRDEDYDEVMGQIVDAQRSGWSEDNVTGDAGLVDYNSDVY